MDSKETEHQTLQAMGERIAAIDVTHPLLAFCGGVTGAYALVARGGNLAAAQTTNLLELVLDGVDGNLADVLLRAGILALYVAAIALAHLAVRTYGAGWRKACIAFEMALVLVAGIVPASTDPLLALVPIFAMSAIQWVTFSDKDHYNSSTIFSTNNVKQTVIATIEYLETRDAAQRAKALFFARTLGLFHLGALCGVLSCLAWGVHGVWFALPVMCGVLALEAAPDLLGALASQFEASESAYLSRAAN